ncbi:MAG: DUF4129 domain-containing protein [Chloroflexota bacterium]
MRSIFVVWLIAFLSLTNISAVSQPPHTLPSGTPVTVEGYWELVRNTRQALAKMEALPEAAIRQQLDGLASEWGKVTAVEFPDQSRLQIDSSVWVSALKTNPPDIKQLEKFMDALLQAHEQYPQKVFTVQDVAALKTILARPEFQWSQPAPVEAPTWLQKLIDGFFNLMERIAFGLGNAAYYGRVPLIVAIALLFVFSLFYISKSLSRNLVRDAQLAAEDGDEDGLLTSKGAMQRAQTLSSQGDYRTAVRYLYLSSLLILDEQGLLRYDRSRTNREYLRSVSSKPELANPLRDVIDVFDRVWYGFDAVDEETYQSYVKHVDDLREKE